MLLWDIVILRVGSKVHPCTVEPEMRIRAHFTLVSGAHYKKTHQPEPMSAKSVPLPLTPRYRLNGVITMFQAEPVLARSVEPVNMHVGNAKNDMFVFILRLYFRHGKGKVQKVA